MSYREYPSPPALEPRLECTWERRSDGAPPVRVLPDGCVDVVWIEGAGTQIAGANTTAFVVRLTVGTHVVGARLCPGAALLMRAAKAERPDRLVRAAVTRLAAPDAAIARLAGDLGVSERQLRRRVTAAVGYGPKRLARVLRLRCALEAVRAGEDLVRAALDAGYADQAHFANDCRALTGVSPSVVVLTT